MAGDKMVMERILDNGQQDSVVIVGGRKGSEVVDVKIRNRRFNENNKTICSPSKIISILCIVIMVQVILMVSIILNIDLPSSGGGSCLSHN